MKYRRQFHVQFTAALIILISLFGTAEAQLLGSADKSTLYPNNDVVIQQGTVLEKALEDIERKYQVAFLYQAGTLEGKVIIEDKFLPSNVDEAISDIISGQDLIFQKLNNKTYGVFNNKSEAKRFKRKIQETVSGTVTSSQRGEPIPGANILVKGTNTGTSTDLEGQFDLEVPSLQDTLVVSYIGYQTREIPIAGRTNIDIVLQSKTITGKEVVVTALGGRREERSVGYSAQNVSGADISTTPNISEGIQGRVAGADVTSASGTVGSSNRIVLRGNSSLSGDNQPLYIVDGVYIDNSNFNAPDGDEDVSDFGNAAMDIDPNNIKSINVLKGPNAAALYGSRAANGAIVITTKDGTSRQGLQVSFDSKVQFSRPWLSTLPDMQNQYGQGYNGQFEYVDGRGGGVNDATDASWGPPLDGRMKKQWWSPNEAVPWEPHPDNVINFFETGNNISNSISVASNLDNVNYRFSVSNSQNDGIYPNVSSDKNDFQINLGADLTDKLTINARTTYTNYIARNMPDVGYSYPGNPLMGLVTWGARQLDMSKVRSAYFNNPGEEPRYWNKLFFDNIYWEMYENTKRQERNRIIGGINLQYDLKEWLSLNSRFGIDWYHEQRNNIEAYNSISDSDGAYDESDRFIQDLNYSLEIQANRDITQDINLNARLGTEYVGNEYQLNRASTSALEIPGVYSLENSAVRPIVTDQTTNKKVYSIYGSATIGFKEYLYIDLTGRNDWSSTLPSDNREYFYPSASVSFIFTDAFDLDNIEWLEYGKLRASWTRVGNDTEPYQLLSTFQSGEPILGAAPNYTTSTTIFNSDLKPEQTESWEVGADMRFLNNRVTFDVAYYNSVTENQILPTPVSDATGYVTKIINAGSIENKGFEITLGGSPIQGVNFEWDVDVNFTMNENKVIELAPGINSYVVAEDFGVSVEARPGEEFGSLYGTSFQRNDEGKIIVNSRGIPKIDYNNMKNFGSYSGDWQSSITNNVSWKNFNLNFLIDIKSGGTISSGTIADGRAQGMFKETAIGRDGFVFDGGRWSDGAVKEDGSANDITVTKQEFNNAIYYSANEAHIFDASYVKLRRLSLGYSVPQSFLSKLGFVKGMNISVVGNNVWMIHKNIPHIDPETVFSSTTVPGLESQVAPKTRTIAFNLNLDF